MYNPGVHIQPSVGMLKEDVHRSAAVETVEDRVPETPRKGGQPGLANSIVGLSRQCLRDPSFANSAAAKL